MRTPSMIASDPEISAWVAANAGAGKTYTLANRVARLLLADAEPQRILCLTFTKAAAAEMQERLFKQLGEWSMLPDEELRNRIVAIGGDAHTYLPKARRLFAAALETPGGLKVLTLHAFCQIVLSRFPIEAGIPPAFEVLDDQSARELIGEARQHVLERAGSGDETLAAAVALLVTETSEATLTKILDAALGADRRKLDRFFDGADALDVAVRAAHSLKEGETAQSIEEDFCSALARELSPLRAVQDWLGGGGASDIQAAGELAAVFDGDIAGSFAALGQFFLTTKGEPRKKLVSKKLADVRPDLLDYLSALQLRYCAAHERRRAARAAELAHAALTIIQAMRRDYQNAKRLRGVLDYDDLIAETRNLLHKSGAAALGALQAGRRHRSSADRRSAGHQPRAMGDRAQADRGVFRRRRARARAGPHDFRGGRRETVHLQLPGRRSRPVRHQPPPLRRRDRGRRTAFAGSAADHFAPFRPGNPELCRQGVRKRDRACRPDLPRRRDHPSRPSRGGEGRHRILAGAGAGRGRRSGLLRPGGHGAEAKPGGPAGGAGGRQDRGLAEKRRPPARP